LLKPERASTVAGELGARGTGLDSLEAQLPEMDVVVCATRAQEHVIRADMVRGAMRRRGNRPLVLVDIAVPRDVDPEVERLEGVFLHDMDSLKGFVDRSLEKRRDEARRGEEIVEEEVDRLMAWLSGLGATPVVRALRERFEEVRLEELEKGLKHFAEEDRPRVERLTRALVNKLLHLPTTRLKAVDAGSEAGAERLALIRDLFALEKSATEEDREP
jgi:glutamyl-tRNA reductase